MTLVVSGGKAIVELPKDGGLIHILWKPKVRIGAADAHAAIDAVNAIAKESRYPLLVDMTQTESLSREARSVFTIPCAASRIALLGASPVDRLLANWYLAVHSTTCPTRFFNSKAQAIEWLTQ